MSIQYLGKWYVIMECNLMQRNVTESNGLLQIPAEIVIHSSKQRLGVVALRFTT